MLSATLPGRAVPCSVPVPVPAVAPLVASHGAPFRRASAAAAASHRPAQPRRCPRAPLRFLPLRAGLSTVPMSGRPFGAPRPERSGDRRSVPCRHRSRPRRSSEPRPGTELRCAVRSPTRPLRSALGNGSHRPRLRTAPKPFCCPAEPRSAEPRPSGTAPSVRPPERSVFVRRRKEPEAVPVPSACPSRSGFFAAVRVTILSFSLIAAVPLRARLSPLMPGALICPSASATPSVNGIFR